MSIILLTIVTRLAILPLSLKQIRSMRALQAHQPQIKEIQEKYKDDRQRLQREMMAFYQENKVNPFASCVPLLLQLPVFFVALLPAAQRRVLDTSSPPAGTRASWASPLDEKATGAALIILIVLYFVTMVGSTSIMSASAEGNQRLMMYALPLVFTPFVINFPAGLIVYWITTNFWTMGQQWVVKQVIPPPPKPTEVEERATEAPATPAAQEETKRR